MIKKMRLIIIFSIFALISFFSLPAYAQMEGNMMNNQEQENDDHTKKEEIEGLKIWEQIQTKEKSCADLSDEDFAALGEYFMGRMLGETHPAMNQMMIQMMGEDFEEEMHAVMGKRLSDCDPNASYPKEGTGFMPMLQMMGNGFYSGSRFSMHSSGTLGVVGWITLLLIWIFLLAAATALFTWIKKQNKR